jgi:hypothetical protein
LGQVASAAGPRSPACPKCSVHSLNAVRRRRKPRTLNSRCGSVRSNTERMRYPTYLEQGLPIGSGAVESAAKHLVQQRMERAGMRWSDLGARAILHLRWQPCSTPQFGPRRPIRDSSRFHPAVFGRDARFSARLSQQEL